MKKSTNSNMYRAATDEIRALFGDLVEGSGDETVLVASSTPLSEAARDAIMKSVSALGYGDQACAFVHIYSKEDGSLALGADDLRTVVEGFDPLCLIITDKATSQLMATGYRQAIPPQGTCRVFGRDAVVFTAFESMLGTSEEKQRAWALLKRLPRS